jgi:hypothetical protein
LSALVLDPLAVRCLFGAIPQIAMLSSCLAMSIFMTAKPQVLSRERTERPSGYYYLRNMD